MIRSDNLYLSRSLWTIGAKGVKLCSKYRLSIPIYANTYTTIPLPFHQPSRAVLLPQFFEEAAGNIGKRVDPSSTKNRLVFAVYRRKRSGIRTRKSRFEYTAFPRAAVGRAHT